MIEQRKTFPKLELGIYPTPLYRLDNISKITGLNVLIKRDDLCGVALGGNKVRKLEYLLKYAIDNGYDTIITTGGVQSNHAMLTAACCGRLGLDVKLVLRGKKPDEMKGNLLLNELLDVPVTFVDTYSMTDVYTEIGLLMKKLESKGKKPYFIPIGASVPLGSVGYVDCVDEIAAQAGAMGVTVDHIVCTTGSGGTHAGLLTGATYNAALRGGGMSGGISSDIKVTGMVVSDEEFATVVSGIANETAKLLELDCRVSPEEVNLYNCFGPGYAKASAEGLAAMKLMLKNEGIVLDPVYTGKAFAGFLELREKGYFHDNETVVFVHTGGSAGVFAIT